MAVSKLVEADRIRHATFVGYQSVKCWVMTQNKKGKMPAFDSLLPKEMTAPRSGRPQTSAQMEAMLHMMAAGIGGRVKNPRLGAGK